MQRKIEIPKPTILAKALEDFNYFNNSGNFEIKKGDVLELNNELAKDFIRQKLMEEVKEEPLIELKEVKIDKNLPLKTKKHKEGE